MRVTLWVPAADSPRWPCVEAWMRMNAPEGCSLNFYRSLANNIKYSWNLAVRDFLESGDDWLFSCHNDVVIHPDTLPRLLSWGLPLVSALVFQRQSPTTPHVWKSYTPDQNYYAMRVQDTHDWFMTHKNAIRFGPQVLEPRPDDALTPVSFTSTSCTLIKREVLTAMSDPWFLWDDDYNGGGEDRRFFLNAAAAGYPAFVDRSCVAGHLAGDIPTGVADFMAWESVSRYEGTGER